MAGAVRGAPSRRLRGWVMAGALMVAGGGAGAAGSLSARDRPARPAYVTTFVTAAAIRPVATTPALPDLVVTELSSWPAAPDVGEPVTFAATIKNIGTASTPPGTLIGVAFRVDAVDETRGVTDRTLRPGGSTTLIASSGIGGSPTWSATRGGHGVTAVADDANRVAERREDNNTLAGRISVADPLPAPPWPAVLPAVDAPFAIGGLVSAALGPNAGPDAPAPAQRPAVCLLTRNATTPVVCF